MIVISLVLLALAVPIRADDKAKDEETLKNAGKVLSEMLSGNAVPADVLARANCIVVLPSVKKFGVVVGGSGGRGPMSCRGGKDFSGRGRGTDHVAQPVHGPALEVDTAE
jgi:lipid-binding SYLF domain-containing protein